ncbi:TetR/AcrR family transcriptional regulator [Streptomyces sp. ISL-98]|uniref:TetR/AcrR family transcriptional regulator n=1 Tax=Streptomyces sp. ISL-98 TaxID=2819192 RepID=UPI001BE672C9|nr:TetR/AcrR family transcriptional regulator [Streptomyces sp. ISL-98]MBT2507496.1 TetR/AcrR family transcriptional regulator [Streptomyces sp. ISL-98]
MQLRAEQTRKAIIAAAAGMIDIKGLKDSGLVEISNAAGVSKGALYFHFSCKEALASAVRVETHKQVRRVAERHLCGPDPDLATLARFLTELFAALREDTALRAGLRMESEERPANCDGPLPLRQEWLHYLHRHFAFPGDGVALPNLLATVTVGLEALGRENHYWWTEETVNGIWELLLRLVPETPEAGSADS